MKIKSLLLFLFVFQMFAFTACSSDSENDEADIVSASIGELDKDFLMSPVIGNEKVVFRVKNSETTLFAPTFELSRGATIEPKNGTELDFAQPQKYVVTAENGLTKSYVVSFIIGDVALMPLYSFESAKTIDTDSPEGHYHEFYDMAKTDTIYTWSTANLGYNILAETLLGDDEELIPAFYPTAQTEDGYKGKGVKLQTKETGPMGSLFGSPLAAGNLFLGYFKFNIPTIKSTRFGIPYTFASAPKAVKGYFKYKAGENFVINSDRGSELEKDTWDVYAILFEKTDDTDGDILLGDHAFVDERIVSIARINASQRVETDSWTEFEIKFENVKGKSYSSDKDYMFTIVFSSSLEGDRFNGAVGSTLVVDEVAIITE